MDKLSRIYRGDIVKATRDADRLRHPTIEVTSGAELDECPRDLLEKAGLSALCVERILNDRGTFLDGLCALSCFHRDLCRLRLLPVLVSSCMPS